MDWFGSPFWGVPDDPIRGNVAIHCMDQLFSRIHRIMETGPRCHGHRCQPSRILRGYPAFSTKFCKNPVINDCPGGVTNYPEFPQLAPSGNVVSHISWFSRRPFAFSINKPRHYKALSGACKGCSLKRLSDGLEYTYHSGLSGFLTVIQWWSLLFTFQQNKLAMACLVLPASNADSERIFSHVKKIHTEFRSELSVDTISL